MVSYWKSNFLNWKEHNRKRNVFKTPDLSIEINLNFFLSKLQYMFTNINSSKSGGNLIEEVTINENESIYSNCSKILTPCTLSNNPYNGLHHLPVKIIQ